MVTSSKKRAAATSIGRGLTLPFPDGGIDAVDRAILSGSYFGFGGDDLDSEEEDDGMKRVDYLSQSQLACYGGNNNEVFLWLKPDLVLPPFESAMAVDFITATVRAGCQEGCNYRYRFEYDEVQLIPSVLLKGSDILGVFCKGPLSEWVLQITGQDATLVVNDDNTLTFTSQHGVQTTFFAGDGVTGILEVIHGGTGVATVPEFFPAFDITPQTWVPVITATGGMVLSNPVIHQADYVPFGETAFLFMLDFSVDLSPVLGNTIIVTSPVAMVGESSDSYKRARADNPMNTGIDIIYFQGSTTEFYIGVQGAPTFAAGGFRVGISGWAKRV